MERCSLQGSKHRTKAPTPMAPTTSALHSPRREAQEVEGTTANGTTANGGKGPTPSVERDKAQEGELTKEVETTKPTSPKGSLQPMGPTSAEAGLSPDSPHKPNSGLRRGFFNK